MFQYGKQIAIPATATPLVPASAFHLEMGGKFLTIQSSSENLNVELFDKGMNSMGVLVGCVAGQQIPVPYGGFNLSTASGNIGNAYIIVSDYPVTIFNLSGTVNIVDTSSPRYTSVAGQGYSCQFSAGPVAAQFTRFRLRNPAASGKNLVLTGLNAWLNPVGSYDIFLETVGADLGNAITIKSRRSTGALASAAVATWDTNAAEFAAGGRVDSIPLQAQVLTIPDVDANMWTVAPGDAFEVCSNIVNAQIAPTIYWEEWPVGTL